MVLAAQWLEAQMIFSIVVVTALFCFSTGQLEAWWALFDPNDCSPPSLERTQWRYPSCDVGSVTERNAAESVELFDDPSAIMAGNDTCWQESVPSSSPSGCPFASTKPVSPVSAKQWSYRLAVFVAIQNIQVMLFFTAKNWNNSHEDGSEKEWVRKRIQQHKLVAESIFPTSALERVQQQARAIQERSAFMNLVKASTTPKPTP